VDDVRAESADARLFRSLVRAEGVELERGPYGFIRSLMWVPLVSRGQLIGMLSIAKSRPDAYGPRAAELALAIGRQAAAALDNAQLHERARQAAALEERERLARDLHDSVTQSLYGASLYAEAAGRALADGEVEPAVANLEELRGTIQEAQAEMRLLLFELRPPLLEEQGLTGALRSRLNAVEVRAGLVTSFEGEAAPRLPAEIEQELFRIAQEGLNNVLKHAHATRVSVRLDVSDGRIALEIADNGLGFEPSLGGGGGFGLASLQQRAERLGGTLRLDSAPGSGTRVCVEVPRRR
jgi:signal transduction histidine kinase